MTTEFKKWLNKTDESITTNASFATVIIVIFLLLILFMPYVLTHASFVSEIAKDGNIGSNIGGITAPFVGVLSALLVYVSFRAQVKANQFQMNAFKEQIENNQKDEDLKFVYYRLQELQSLNKKGQASANVKVISDRIKELAKHLTNETVLPEKIHAFRSEVSFNLVSVERYVNTIAMIQAMMKKIICREKKKQRKADKESTKIKTGDNNKGFDVIQNNYIRAVVRYEFQTVLNSFIAENQQTIDDLETFCTNKKLQGLEALFQLIKRIKEVKTFADDNEICCNDTPV